MDSEEPWFVPYAFSDEEDEYDLFALSEGIEFDLFGLDEMLEALAKACTEFSETPPKKNPHRPAGTVKDPSLFLLIRVLHEGIVRICGGKLAVGKNGGG
jgi:hypothetical protein